MNKAKQKRNWELAQRHLGIVAKVGFHYWRGLPVHVQVNFKAEDMISDTVLAVARQAHRYQVGRGAESTFVWRIAENHCKNILISHRQQKRSACEIISLETTRYRGGANERGGNVPAVESNIVIGSKPDAGVRWLEARGGFERLLEFASTQLKESLERFFADRRITCFCEQDLDELRSLSRQHHVSRGDFELALKVV